MIRLIAFRILALVAVLVSSALMVDYVRPVPAFCGFRAGCDQVVNSAYWRLLGIPLPALGVLTFAVFYWLTFLRSSLVQKLLGPMAISAGLVGLVLVLLQKFVLQQLCPFCLIVDIAAILLAAVELGLSGERRGVSAVSSSPSETSDDQGNANAELHTEGLRPAARLRGVGCSCGGCSCAVCLVDCETVSSGTRAS